MVVYITLGFLFLPNRMTSLLWVIISFYFWAGLLKLNSDWLDGLSLGSGFLTLPPLFKIFSTYFVVFLELVMVWGLLAKPRWIVVTVAVGVLIFHLFSVWIVGYYYPLLMILILSVVFFRLRFKIDSNRPNLSTLIFVGIIAAFNLWSYQMPGDKAITGEGRVYSFHMFDATVDCQAKGIIKFENGKMETRNLRLPVQTRIQCDPILFLGRIKSLRENYKTVPLFQDIDLQIVAKRISEPAYRPLVDEVNVCRNALSYQIFFPNDWIKK